VIVAAAGALAGAAVGAPLSIAAAVAGGWPSALSLGGITLAVVLAVAVGLGSVAYPAYRAAALDPRRGAPLRALSFSTVPGYGMICAFTQTNRDLASSSGCETPKTFVLVIVRSANGT